MADTAPKTGARPLRTGLRIVAGLTVALTLAWWTAKGAHRGWSQDQVPVKQKDEITGLDYVTYEKRFVPGVDALGAGLLLGAALFGVSFFVQRNPTKTS